MIDSYILWGCFAFLLMIFIHFVSILFGYIYKRNSIKKLNKITKNKLVLTYDDGPSVFENGTIELLCLLNKLKVKGTFYLIGWRALKSPDICDKIKIDHHEIGCHTTHHIDSWRTFRIWKTLQDIVAGYSELKQWCKIDAPFRPPRGHLTFFTWLLLKKNMARIDFWTHDAKDTQNSLFCQKEFISKVAKFEGAVVLMHCHHRDRKNLNYTLELTRKLVDLARQNGWEIKTMAQLYHA